MNVISTRNIFLDSDLNTFGSYGEQMRVSVPSQNFSCKGNEIMKISLKTFVIRRNWYSINNSNNVFFLIIDDPLNIGSELGYYPVIIPQGTYSFGSDIASNVNTNEQLPYDYADDNLLRAIKYAVDKTLLLINVGGKAKSPYADEEIGNRVFAPLNIQGSGFVKSGVSYNKATRKLSISFTLPKVVSIFNTLKLRTAFFQIKDSKKILNTTVNLNADQFFTTNNSVKFGDWIFQDSHEILGGARTTDNDLNANAFNKGVQTGLKETITVGTNTVAYSFSSFFPAQLNTLEAVYLRMISSTTNNFESGTLDRDSTNYGLVPTNIFAKIPLLQSSYDTQSDIISYKDTGDDSYSVLLDTHQLSTLQFYISDDKNRYIQPADLQAYISGNLNFKMTIKYEILASSSPLNYVPPSLDIAASMSPVGFVRPTQSENRAINDQTTVFNHKSSLPFQPNRMIKPNP